VVPVFDEGWVSVSSSLSAKEINVAVVCAFETTLVANFECAGNGVGCTSTWVAMLCAINDRC